MKKLTSKRDFLKRIGLGLTYLALSQVLDFKKVRAKYRPKIVILGAGFGGASCLQYFKKFSNKFDITVIEKKRSIQTCPFSNHVIGGITNLSDITFDLMKMRENKNFDIIFESVSYIDSEKKTVKFENDQLLKYDFLILSPGIGFKWNKIEGYNKTISNYIPHYWDGNKDLTLFAKKLSDLEDHSRIIISAPEYPYRCPPAPYERASLIANYLKMIGKRFKIILLDSKNTFTKKDLFLNEWNINYKKSIEWISRKNGGKVEKVDIRNKSVTTNNGSVFKADLIHIIPEQRASEIMFKSNLVKKDWCDVNPNSFELVDHKNIYALGDSINAWDMPKSGFSANSQAKILSLNLINRILDKDYFNPVFLNTCYSFSSANRAFSITSWYRVNASGTKIVSLGSKESDIDGTDYDRFEESNHAKGWYKSITNQIYD